MLKKILLPFTVLAVATLVGEHQAHAAETPTRAAKAPAKIALTPTSGSIGVAQSANRAVPATVLTKGAALLGQPSIARDRASSVEAFSTYRFSVAQTPQTSPSTETPGRAVPSAAPSNSGTTTQTTPSTAPDSTTPSTPNAVPTAPGSSAPLTPTSPAAPTPTTPNSSPSTQTTPDTTTPSTTTPSTTTPDTTTPGTTTPTTPTSPDTTITPGRATRSGSSYIGVGGNIGIGSGDTALGQGSFAILSKIGLTRSFSVRPSILFTDNVTILLPVTYDFSFGEGPTSGFGFTAAPFVGVGAAISTGGGGDVGLLLTGGLDVPLSRDFTATAAVNASVTGKAAVGITLGVGYNFAGF